MPIKSYSIDEIHDRMVNKMVNHSADTTVALTAHPLNLLALSASGAISSLYDALEDAIKGSFVMTASGNDLDRIGSFWNVTRGRATHASGSISFTATEDVTIPKNVAVSSADGTIYTVIATSNFTDGDAIIAFQAKKAGKTGNLIAKQELSWVEPMRGVASYGIVTDAGFIGGADAESDTLYRGRILLELRNPSKNGSISDYENWALARQYHTIPVSRAFVKGGAQGKGTVDIFIMIQNEDDLLAVPNANQMAKVKEFIDANRPVGTTVFVKTPDIEDVTLNISKLKISSGSNKTQVEAQIKQALSAHFMRLASPGASISLTSLYETINDVAHVDDFILQSPTSNLTPTNNTNILKPTIVTFSA